CLTATSLLRYARALARAFGPATAGWYILFQATQFHIPFYATRTLPNTFALLLTTEAARAFLPVAADAATWRKRTTKGIYLLVAAGVIFRAEIALLLATQVGYLLLTRRTTLRTVILAGLPAAILSIGISVAVDSAFWLRPVWPELESFIFNVYNGASSEWGVSPWHTYFSSSLPKLLLNPLAIPLIATALYLPATARNAGALVIPQLAFVALYSAQPHKEARFVIYAIPPLTAAAALGASYVWTRRARGVFYRLGSLVLLGGVGVSFLASMGMLFVSALNYPGGEALWMLHQRMNWEEIDVVRVHMDVLSCMTGVSKFQEEQPTKPLWGAGDGSLLIPTAQRTGIEWHYDKTEDEATLRDPAFWEQFDFALMADPSRALGNWKVTEVVWGFAGGLEVLKPGECMMYGRESVASEVLKLAWDYGDVRIATEFLGNYEIFKDAMRRSVTGGWWVGPKMEHKIHIMKRMPPGWTMP
ncbi:hypothetical protein V492_05082, partial [Pseudogymnoascus sp. VKM F-4246]